MFVGGLILVLPPTETKASWKNVAYTSPARVYDPPQPAAEEPSAYPVSYTPQPEPAFQERPDRYDRQMADEQTAREIAIAEQDRAYGDGYAWAADQEVQSPRECRRLDDARREGCRDYVASLDRDQGGSEDLSVN